MLNHIQYLELERRLWREGNPLADEIASTRDELSLLISEVRKVIFKYSLLLNDQAGDDLDYMREWDNLADYVDNLQYVLEGRISND